MAAEHIEEETPNSEGGKLAREQLKKQRPELFKALRLEEAARTFNRLVLGDETVLTIDERFIVPPEASPLKLPSGQDAVRAFVEDRNRDLRTGGQPRSWPLCRARVQRRRAGT